MPAPTLNLSQAQLSGAFRAMMYFDETSGLYVPISSTNRLPVDAALSVSSVTLAESFADGADATQGAIADAAVAAGATGTQSAKLRGLSRDVGAMTEGAPASDTASSGLNGRLQRIAQRLTSLIALIPAALGQGTMAQSLSVTVASNQSAVPVSGTVTASGPVTDTQLRASAVPMSIADGGNVAQGAVADAVVAAGATGTISAKLRAISRDVGTTAALSKNSGTTDATTLRVVTASDGPLNTNIAALLARTGHSPRISITRPNDTNAYTAGDVVGPSTASAGAVWEFTNIGIANGTVLIKDLYFEIDVTSIPSGMSSFRLHLYNATPPSALGDNAAWTLASGDRTAYLGYIDIPLPTLITSTTVFLQVANLDKMFPMGATTSLFAYLVSNGAYTPTAQAVKVIRMNSIDL